MNFNLLLTINFIINRHLCQSHTKAIYYLKKPFCYKKEADPRDCESACALCASEKAVVCLQYSSNSRLNFCNVPLIIYYHHIVNVIKSYEGTQKKHYCCDCQHCLNCRLHLFFAVPQLQQKLPVLLVPQPGQVQPDAPFCH